MELIQMVLKDGLAYLKDIVIIANGVFILYTGIKTEGLSDLVKSKVHESKGKLSILYREREYKLLSEIETLRRKSKKNTPEKNYSKGDSESEKVNSQSVEIFDNHSGWKILGGATSISNGGELHAPIKSIMIMKKDEVREIRKRRMEIWNKN